MAGFFGFIDKLFDPIFNPLLSLGALTAVITISILISVIMTLIYKWTTDQKLMKELKDKMKSFQTLLKENRTNPEKAMSIQKEAMQVNMQYMMQSLRPTLFTFIPIIIIFSWLSSNVAYMPLIPHADFTTTVVFKEGVNGSALIEAPEDITVNGPLSVQIEENKAVWSLKGKAGQYILNFKYNDKLYSKELLIDSQQYLPPEEFINNDAWVASIKVDHPPQKFDFKFFRLGWIWVYIIISIIASLALRKALKIY